MSRKVVVVSPEAAGGAYDATESLCGVLQLVYEAELAAMNGQRDQTLESIQAARMDLEDILGEGSHE